MGLIMTYTELWERFAFMELNPTVAFSSRPDLAVSDLELSLWTERYINTILLALSAMKATHSLFYESERSYNHKVQVVERGSTVKRAHGRVAQEYVVRSCSIIADKSPRGPVQRWEPQTPQGQVPSLICQARKSGQSQDGLFRLI